MIPHNAALDAAYGLTTWRPFTRVTFRNPSGGGAYSEVVADGVEGMLTSSSTAWPRTTLDLTVPGGITPALTSLPVTPYGGLVRVEAGAYIGSTLYSFQVCELDVDEVTIERPSGTIYVHAVSHEARVNDDVQPFLASSITSQASVWIVDRVSATLGIYGTGPVYPNTVSLTNDVSLNYGEVMTQGTVWDTVEQLMAMCGGEAYFRYDGRLILRDEPVKGTSVLTIKGDAGGTLLRYRSMRRWAASVAYVSFEKSDGSTQLGQWLQTTGPAASTGPYGRHAILQKRTVQTLPSAAKANAAAATAGKRAAAPMRRVELDAIPAPWLEPGDTISVQLQGETAETHLVTGVRWPLSQLGPMTIVTQDSTFAG